MKFFIKSLPGYDDTRPWLQQPKLPWYLAFLAILLTLPALSVGLQGDDFIHRAILLDYSIVPPAQDMSLFGMYSFYNGNPVRNLQMMDHGLLPWWAFEHLLVSFWRPLTEFTLWFDYQLWPNLPFLMHLHNIVWYGALVWAVSKLYRGVMGMTSVAGVAALLYAIARVHGRSLIMVASRSSLIATFLGVLTLLAYDRTIKKGWKAGVITGPLCLLLALLSAEYAIVTIAYLFAYSVFMDHRKLQARFWNLTPYILVVTGWMMIYKIAGFGTSGCGVYTDPIQQPLLFMISVGKRLPVLFGGQWLPLPMEIFAMLPPFAATIMWIGLVMFIVIVSIVLFPILRRDNRARFWALGFMLAMIPMCASLPDDRLSIFVGLGAIGLLAQFLTSVYQKANWLPTLLSWKIPAKALFYMFLLTHFVISPILLPIKTVSFAHYLNPRFNQPAVSIPIDSNFTQQTMVFINPPGILFAKFIPYIRLTKGLSLPAFTRILADGSTPMTITRKDKWTLEIQLEGGFISTELEKFFRSSSLPMKVGQQVELSGMSVTVVSLTEDHRPDRVSFHFDVPLEDSSLKFLQWQAHAIIPFTLPAIGETVFLKAVPAF